jgi:ElaA protein
VLRINDLEKDRVKLQRFCVLKEFRGLGLGKRLFGGALEYALKNYPERLIRIEAQIYLEEFYQNFGFKTVSEPFLDAGIVHVEMVYER